MDDFAAQELPPRNSRNPDPELHFTGFLWRFSLLADSIRIRFILPIIGSDNSITYESIKRLDFQPHHQRLFLCQHTKAWRKPEAEVFVALGDFNLKDSIRILTVLRERCPEAVVDPEIRAFLETGTGL